MTLLTPFLQRKQASTMPFPVTKPTIRRKCLGTASAALGVAFLMAAGHNRGVLGFSSRPLPTFTHTVPKTKANPTSSIFRPTLPRTRLWEQPDQFIDVEVVSDATDGAMANPTMSKKKSTDPTPALAKYFKDQKHAASVAAIAALAMSLVLTPLPSFAAMSGGRMGGSFSSPSRSMSVPSSRGYSSGYSRGFSSGYGSGYYSRGPSVFVSPYVSPFPSFNPFYSPGYYGGGGVIGYRGPGLLTFLMFGGLMLAATSAVSSGGRGLTTSWSDSDVFSDVAGTTALGSGNSVVQVSVALEVPNRDDRNSILGVLDRLSRTARTDSRVGIQNLTSQVALELLRRKSSIVSASTNYKHYRDRTKALRDFNDRSIKERGKFERETVSKYGGVDYGQGGDSSRGVDGKATMVVVTLLLTIDGDSTNVPTIRSANDVEEALRKIAADAKVDDCLQGAEILWTPEDRSETLSPRDVVADYPELRSI